MNMVTAPDETMAKRAGSTSHVWGYVLVLGSGLFFVTSIYWMLLSKLLPVLDQLVVQPRDPSASGLLSAMETDTYYCYLVPLTIPITMVACYANWVSLKFFRHN